MPRYQPIPLIGVALATALAGSPDARAGEGRWALCSAPLLDPMPPATEPVAGDGERIDITADRVQASGQPPIYEFTGSVRARQGDQRLSSERLRYDSGDGRVEGDSGVRLRQPGVLINAERARYWLTPQRGTFEGVSDYRIVAGHMQGQADRIIREGPTLSRYQGVTLSTCMPGREFWTLQAQRAEIDRDTRQGRAHHAVLSLGRLPVFYTPYLQFPVGSERLTGLLAPTIGQSYDNGTTVSVPWYWNIAPQYDATLRPTLYSRRGLLMDTEFRYLEEWIDGEFNVSVLPDDDVFGDDRWAIDQDHQLAIGSSIRGRIKQARVSDAFYSDDFSNELDVRSASFLESEASFAWTGRDSSLSVDTQYWQQIDTRINTTSQPYAREPRLQYRYNPITGLGPLDIDFDAEATRFTHPVSRRTQGRRVDIAPRVSLPWRRRGYFIEPAVTWRHTDYDLTGDLPGRDATPSRSMPIYSVDAGVFLERPSTLFAGVYQTLEPRLFYRRAPTRDQSDLPDFDTSASTLTFSSMFRENAFAGLDRIEDGERLSTGITTRFVNTTSGQEYLSASIGQIFYFKDREVAADGDPADSRSEIVSQLRLDLPRGFSADLDYRWDPDSTDTDNLGTLLRWRGRDTQAINLGLRRRRDEGETTLDQAELSFALPLTRGVRVFAGLLEDLETDNTRERFIGIQQSGCCHAWRLVSEEQLQRDPDRADARLERTVMLELELKGLGGIGDRLQSFLDAEIDGYNPRR